MHREVNKYILRCSESFDSDSDKGPDWDWICVLNCANGWGIRKSFTDKLRWVRAEKNLEVG